MAPEVATFALEASPVSFAIALLPDWASTVPASLSVTTVPWMTAVPVPVRSCLTLPFLKVIGAVDEPIVAVSVPEAA